MIDESTGFGARAAAHLRDDPVVWLTSVNERGAPLPTPVWFFWDGDQIVHIHSRADARRVEHVRANPRVSLNFGGDGQGGDIVVLSGRAHIVDGPPPRDRHEAYMAKYRSHIERLGMTPDGFLAEYPVMLEVELTRLRGH